MALYETDPIVLQTIIGHVFLPAKLPDGADDVLGWEKTLLDLLESSLDGFERIVDPASVSRVHKAQKSLLKLNISRQTTGYLDEAALRDGLMHLGEYCWVERLSRTRSKHNIVLTLIR